MERMAWTDERNDDFVHEMREFRRETRDELRGVRGEIAALRTDMTRFGFGLAGAFVLQLLAVLVAIVVGT